VSILNEDNLKEMRRIRLLDIKLWSILNELGLFTIFLIILYVISFVNLSTSSFIYNQLFLNTFVNKQNSNEVGLHDVILIFSLIIKIKEIITFF
jgi:hypothetical protein